MPPTRIFKSVPSNHISPLLGDVGAVPLLIRSEAADVVLPDKSHKAVGLVCPKPINPLLLIGATQVYSNFGEQRMLNFNTIITGRDPSTKRTVKQLLNSMADIDASQSGIVNVYKDGYKHVELYYLSSTATGAYDSTKRRWWFMGAIGHGPMQSWQAMLGEWIAPTLVTPSAGNNGEDVHNYNWTFSTYSRYGIAVLSGRGLIASCPVS